MNCLSRAAWTAQCRCAVICNEWTGRSQWIHCREPLLFVCSVSLSSTNHINAFQFYFCGVCVIAMCLFFRLFCVSEHFFFILSHLIASHMARAIRLTLSKCWAEFNYVRHRRRRVFYSNVIKSSTVYLSNLNNYLANQYTRQHHNNNKKRLWTTIQKI